MGNLYYNNGYVFSNIQPIEQNISGDSIDLEMRVLEGPQAHLSHVRIYGNNRLYEEVVRREPAHQARRPVLQGVHHAFLS